MYLMWWAFLLLFCMEGTRAVAQSAASGTQQSSPPELTHRPVPGPEARREKIKLDVLVTDASGHPVSGLMQQDFTLLDDKKPQPILSFRAVEGSANSNTENEPPVEVILLIDEANNHLRNIGYERYQIDKFLKQNGGRLAQPTTLMIFTDRGVQTQPQPATDGNAIAQAFDRQSMSMHTIPLAGGYDALERLELSLKTLRMIATAEQPKPGRKLLIWIGPGWPMLEGPGYRQSDRSQRSGFNVIVETSQMLREARVTLYSINAFDPGSGQQMRMDFYKSFLKPAKAPHEFQSGDLAVPVFAVHSGGRVFDSTGDLAKLIDTCVAEAKAYYTIGFDPAEAEHTDEYHSIDITVAKPGLSARTNAGYYAEPLPKP